MNIAFKFITEILTKYENRNIVVLGIGHKAIAVCNYLKAIQKQSKISFLAKLPNEDQNVVSEEFVIRNAYDILYFVETTIVIIANDYIEDSITFLNNLSGEIVYEIWKFDTAKSCDYIDPLLGYSRKDDLPGYSVYRGEQNQAKILVLGGSTSDHTFDGIRSWPYFLYNILNKKVTIFNGGIVGYNSSQELLKLCRDISTIHPDMVISYSGINDCYRGTMDFDHPYTSPFYRMTIERMFKKENNIQSPFTANCVLNYGLDNKMPPCQTWIENERKMYGICNSIGVKFLGIFQISLFSTGYLIQDEEIKYLSCRHSKRAIDEYFSNVQYIEQYINHCTEKYLYSFHHIIQNCNSLFYDHCHGGEELNEIIAKNVYSIIKSI